MFAASRFSQPQTQSATPTAPAAGAAGAAPTPAPSSVTCHFCDAQLKSQANLENHLVVNKKCLKLQALERKRLREEQKRAKEQTPSASASSPDEAPVAAAPAAAVTALRVDQAPSGTDNQWTEPATAYSTWNASLALNGTPLSQSSPYTQQEQARLREKQLPGSQEALGEDPVGSERSADVVAAMTVARTTLLKIYAAEEQKGVAQLNATKANLEKLVDSKSSGSGGILAELPKTAKEFSAVISLLTKQIRYNFGGSTALVAVMTTKEGATEMEIAAWKDFGKKVAQATRVPSGPGAAKLGTIQTFDAMSFKRESILIRQKEVIAFRKKLFETPDNGQMLTLAAVQLWTDYFLMILPLLSWWIHNALIFSIFSAESPYMRRVKDMCAAKVVGPTVSQAPEAIPTKEEEVW